MTITSELTSTNVKFSVPLSLNLSHTIDAEGIHPCNDKLKEIPENVKELRSFNGIRNFYHKFIPNVSSVMEHSLEFIKKNMCLGHGLWSVKMPLKNAKVFS
ncbi:hypothetical protein PR048_012940 [Dryococelus australis]|uniref:Reverse transcriptase n=1 Tax=Dryococelus australis TaxID=614101 RepID=A0ABQ9HQS6_9NEOP|nr:hypothetical protein PR048_012940 [Dryococelus australis]